MSNSWSSYNSYISIQPQFSITHITLGWPVVLQFHILQIQFNPVQSSPVQSSPVQSSLLQFYQDAPPTTPPLYPQRGNKDVVALVIVRRKICALKATSYIVTVKRFMIFLDLTSCYPAGMPNVCHNLANECSWSSEPLDIRSVFSFLFHNRIHHKFPVLINFHSRCRISFIRKQYIFVSLDRKQTVGG